MAQYSKEWQHVVVDFRSEVIVFPTTKHQRACYWLVDEATRLRMDAPDAELGARAREAFSRCRTGPREPVTKSDFSPVGVPAPFGYKMGWIAIRTEDSGKVAEALGLHDVMPATWETGVSAAYNRERHVFVTPPVNGWIIAVGWPLMVSGHTLDPLHSLLRRLSTSFGEVQAFGTHRVTEFHYWSMVTGGRIRRAYAFAGDEGRVLLNVGRLTPGEIHAIGSPGKTWVPTEEDVMNIAGRWSINPSVADDTQYESAPGLLGETGSLA
ncbi:MAG TPA: hypothetical protein VNT75_03985 [Symbiobacteriaceae bacterium]|nr:hypothetical protein [Symbiobacteriaceae bacterium]